MTTFLGYRSGFFSAAVCSATGGLLAFPELTAEDIDEARSPVFAGRTARFHRRLRDGHALIGCRVDGRIVCYLWLTCGDREVPLGFGVSFLVPRGTSYVWDCRTDPAYQGRGLYRQGLLAARAWPAGRGGDFLIAVEWSNAPAIRAMRGAGFAATLCRYRLLRLGPFGLYVKDGRLRPYQDGFVDETLLAA